MRAGDEYILADQECSPVGVGLECAFGVVPIGAEDADVRVYC